ncbi:DUF6192 family protein [Streptomyces sp. NPDC058145]|uniref:DUF6192 family protein n=1 Tax=Streptomyces sp. NPDC058145 TaxID=3346356 RepID=UPI0036E99584
MTSRLDAAPVGGLTGRDPGMARICRRAQSRRVCAASSAEAAALLFAAVIAAHVPVQDKIRAVEEPTRNETVAVKATAGLLRRLEVALKVMCNDTARFHVNAQTVQGQQARERTSTTQPRRPGRSADARPRTAPSLWSCPVAGSWRGHWTG